MPSPKLIQILRASTRLTDEQIIELSEKEGWEIVQKAKATKNSKKKKPKKPEICFTGFNLNRREELESQASVKGLQVRKSVTTNLDYLVLGETPGEKKIQKASQQGVKILQLDEYEKLGDFEKSLKRKSRQKKIRKKPQTEEEYIAENIDQEWLKTQNQELVSNDELEQIEKDFNVSINFVDEKTTALYLPKWYWYLTICLLATGLALSIGGYTFVLPIMIFSLAILGFLVKK